MRKGIIVLALSSTALLTSCSSGWSCKARYVKAEKSKEIEKTKTSKTVIYSDADTQTFSFLQS